MRNPFIAAAAVLPDATAAPSPDYVRPQRQHRTLLPYARHYLRRSRVVHHRLEFRGSVGVSSSSAGRRFHAPTSRATGNVFMTVDRRAALVNTVKVENRAHPRAR